MAAFVDDAPKSIDAITPNGSPARHARRPSDTACTKPPEGSDQMNPDGRSAEASVRHEHLREAGANQNGRLRPVNPESCERSRPSGLIRPASRFGSRSCREKGRWEHPENGPGSWRNEAQGCGTLGATRAVPRSPATRGSYWPPSTT